MIRIYFLTAADEHLTQNYPHLTAAKHPYIDFLLFEAGLSGEPNVDIVKRHGLLPSGAINPALLAGSLLSPWREEITVEHLMALETMAAPKLYATANGVAQDIRENKPHHSVLVESESFGSLAAAVAAKRMYNVKLPANISSLHESQTALLAERDELIEQLAAPPTNYVSFYHAFTVHLLKALDNLDNRPVLILSGGYMPLMALLDSRIQHPFAKIATSIFLGQGYYWNPVLELKKDYMLPRPEEGVSTFFSVMGRKAWLQPYYNGHVKEGAGLGYALTMILTMLHDPERAGYTQVLEDLDKIATRLDGMLPDADKLDGN